MHNAEAIFENFERRNRTMTTIESRTHQRRQFGAGVMLIIFMAFAVFQINVSTGIAKPGGGPKLAIFDIVPDTPTLSSSATTGSTFFLTGKIYPFRTVNQADCSVPSGATPLGTWRAWGTVGDGGKLVLHQTLRLETFNSTIEVQGTTGQMAENADVSPVLPGTLAPTAGPAEILAVVGGTGRYEGINGAANIKPYCNPTPTGTSPFRFDRAFCFGLE